MHHFIIYEHLFHPTRIIDFLSFSSCCSSHRTLRTVLLTLPFLCRFRSDAEEEGELEPAKELIQPIAEKLMAKYKAKEEETPLLFFVAGEVRRDAVQNQREPKWDRCIATPLAHLLLKIILTVRIE